MKKTCNRCDEDKSLLEFSTKGKYLSAYCKPCDALRSQKRRDLVGKSKECPIKAARRNRKYLDQARIDRANNNRLAYFVLIDCRGSDRKKNRACDLDIKFVEEMVTRPCIYCGIKSSEAKLTLDRIDNKLGHLRSNVVTACYRCNIMKSDMPYDAWLMLAPMVKCVVESGAFGDWKLWPTNRKALPEQSDLIAAPTQPKLRKEPSPKTSAGGRIQKVSDADYLKALKEHPSIGQALIALGLSPRGKNYTRAKRLLGYANDIRLSTNGKPKSNIAAAPDADDDGH